jgi:NADPH2:quinone reductase
MREFGPPGVLEPAEVDEVRAGPGQAVIEVEFANITFVETQVRAGRPPHPSMLPALPAILGNGVGGMAGAGAGGGSLRVVASLNGTGGYAERAAVAAERLVEVPAEVELRDAVALLADGRTALALADRARLREGGTVLVEAAAGGVGTLLVQLARNAGARVVALAGQPRKLDVARELGAEVAVDYRDEDWARQVREAVGEVDVVFDGVGGDVGLAAFGLLGAGGRFCPFGMASGSFAAIPAGLAEQRQVSVLAGAPVTVEEAIALTRKALAEAAAGRIRPVIGQEFGLADAAAAHAAIESRSTIGKTLLTVPRLRGAPMASSGVHAGNGMSRRNAPLELVWIRENSRMSSVRPSYPDQRLRGRTFSQRRVRPSST